MKSEAEKHDGTNVEDMDPTWMKTMTALTNQLIEMDNSTCHPYGAQTKLETLVMGQPKKHEDATRRTQETVESVPMMERSRLEDRSQGPGGTEAVWK